MTTANKITIARILLVPFFIMQTLYYGETGNEIYRLMALFTFAVAAISDGVDGYIARHYNQRSELGAVLDPLADKLLLVAGVVLLATDVRPDLDRIPFWLATLIIGRDFILLLGLGGIHYTCATARVRPVLTGKLASVLQMTVVLWILLKWPTGWLTIWIWGAAVTTAISGVIYSVDGIRQMSSSPRSAPSPRQEVAPGSSEEGKSGR